MLLNKHFILELIDILLGKIYPFAVMNPLALVAVQVYVPYEVMSAVSVSEAWLLRVIPFGFVCGPISLKNKC